MRLPRCVRLDSSDLQVFGHAAEPGEWAVSGAFAFWTGDPAELTGKALQAFSHGWLGIGSFGRCALVEVAETNEAGFFQAVEQLAAHLVEHYGAPNLATALPAARQELEYAASLCDQPVNTLLAIDRGLNEAGEIVERFRIIVPSRAEQHADIWSLDPED